MLFRKSLIFLKKYGIQKFFFKVLKKLNSFNFSKKKLSYNDLRKFGNEFASNEETLIIYIEFPYEDLLPNAKVLPHLPHKCDEYFNLLKDIPSESYSRVVATGLLEHLSDPEKLLSESYRILKKGGKVFISASSVFPVHRGPDDYFHVTQFGMKELVKKQPWESHQIKGSCGPFKTIAILLERILLQTETVFFIRPFVALLSKIIHFLDIFVLKQYADRSFKEEKLIDTMMPSNIQLIAKK